ncbi:hypothetical protein [Bradyrhizobium vignae]|nr:hypothetical protein [Bradyrhizobium vignae]
MNLFGGRTAVPIIWGLRTDGPLATRTERESVITAQAAVGKLPLAIAIA